MFCDQSGSDEGKLGDPVPCGVEKTAEEEKKGNQLTQN